MDHKAGKANPLENVPWWVKSIALLGIAGVFCYKVVQTPISLQFDFPSFLALLLSMFSMGLAALFYFKATDTSNAFYDNTYKFTRDIAELLVRIESGFGEKLRHLDETYKGMQDRFDQLPSRFQVQAAKKDLRVEEEELGRIVKEKEDLIENLMGKAQLQEEEKEQFLSALKTKEEALELAHKEIGMLQSRLDLALIRRPSTAEMSNYGIILPDPVWDELRSSVFTMIPRDWLRGASSSGIQEGFSSIVSDLPPNVTRHMRKFNLLDKNNYLTVTGIEALRQAAEQMP
jgi:hypothetical protein